MFFSGQTCLSTPTKMQSTLKAPNINTAQNDERQGNICSMVLFSANKMSSTAIFSARMVGGTLIFIAKIYERHGNIDSKQDRQHRKSLNKQNGRHDDIQR